MNHRQYSVTLNGKTPLLMHHDNLAWCERMKAWESDPSNRAISVKGDDRSPAHRWIGYLYIDGDSVVIPSDNLMTMLREGGAKCPTGKRGATFKRQTQSGLIVDQAGWALETNAGLVSTDGLAEMENEKDFSKHMEYAQKMGYTLFPKRAKIGAAKNIRVRPRFDTWSASGSITVFDETITTQILQEILSFAGRYSGLGDWRPSSPKSPGPWGTFTAEVEEVK